MLLRCSVLTVCSVTARRPSPRRWRTSSPSTHPPTCGRSSSQRTSPTRPWCPAPTSSTLLRPGTTSTTTRLQSEWHTLPVEETQAVFVSVTRNVFGFASGFRSREREALQSCIAAVRIRSQVRVNQTVKAHFGRVESLTTSCSCKTVEMQHRSSLISGLFLSVQATGAPGTTQLEQKKHR